MTIIARQGYRLLTIVVASAAFLSAQVQAVTLNQVVRRTLVSNPEVLAARANEEAAKSGIREAQGQFYPQLFLRAAGGRERSVNPAVRAIGKDANTLYRGESSFQARQLLFSGFGVVSQVRQRKYTHKSTKCQYGDILQSTILQTAEVYLNVLRTRKLLKLARDNVHVHEGTLSKVQQRYKGGAGRRVEVSLAKSRLAKARAQLVTAEGQLDEEVSRYCAVTGFPPVLNMMMPTRPVALLPRTEYQAIRTSDKQHPAIYAAQANADASLANVGVAQSRFYPRIDVEFLAAANSNLDGIEGSNGEVMGLAVASYDLFNGFSDYAAVNTANAEKRRSQRLAEQVKRQVHERVRIAAAELKTSRGQIDRFQVNVDQEKQVVMDYKKQFALGQRQLFNVLDAENDLFIARTNLANANYDHAIAYYRVLEAIGGLTLNALSRPVSIKHNRHSHSRASNSAMCIVNPEDQKNSP